MRFVDYRCKKCGQISELVISGSQKVKCPHCESEEMIRIFSGPHLSNRGYSLQSSSSNSKSCSGSCAGCSGCG